jgi:hypothetical protein
LNNNDCASPNVCDTDGVHQSNVCFAITGSPCSSNSDCLTNDCDIGNTNLCIDL